MDDDIVLAMSNIIANQPVAAMWKAHKEKLIIADEGYLVRGARIILPISLRRRALDIVHKTHNGIDSTIKVLKEYVWWPGMRKDVEQRIKSCEICVLLRGKPTPAPMKSVPLPKGPWQHIALDFVDFPQLNACVLVMVDYFSRFVKYIPVKNKEFETVSKVVETVLDFFGSMDKLRHDGELKMSQKLSKQLILMEF